MLGNMKGLLKTLLFAGIFLASGLAQAELKRITQDSFNGTCGTREWNLDIARTESLNKARKECDALGRDWAYKGVIFQGYEQCFECGGGNGYKCEVTKMVFGCESTKDEDHANKRTANGSVSPNKKVGDDRARRQSDIIKADKKESRKSSATAASVATKTTDADIQQDILMAQILPKVKAGNAIDALPYFMELEKLGPLLSKPLSESFYYNYIESLNKAGYRADALTHAEAYLKKFGKAGAHYAQIIETTAKLREKGTDQQKPIADRPSVQHEPIEDRATAEQKIRADRAAAENVRAAEERQRRVLECAGRRDREIDSTLAAVEVAGQRYDNYISRSEISYEEADRLAAETQGAVDRNRRAKQIQCD